MGGGEVPGNQNNSLTKQDLKDWRTNLLIFLAPLGVIYLTAIIAFIQIPGHTFIVNDLIPTQLTLGAMILYVFNGLLDIFKKFLAGS